MDCKRTDDRDWRERERRRQPSFALLFLCAANWASLNHDCGQGQLKNNSTAPVEELMYTAISLIASRLLFSPGWDTVYILSSWFAAKNARGFQSHYLNIQRVGKKTVSSDTLWTFINAKSPHLRGQVVPFTLNIDVRGHLSLLIEYQQIIWFQIVSIWCSSMQYFLCRPMVTL